MFKRVSLALAIVLVLSLASGAWISASAGDPEVPFKAYYPTLAEIIPLSPTCIKQVFTPGGDGLASHMGVSQFSGEATVCFGNPTTQIGDGKLVAANGDYFTVHYDGKVSLINEVRVADGTYVVTGGTGRFWGVTGGGKYHVVVNNDTTQPNDLTFEGHLHNP